MNVLKIEMFILFYFSISLFILCWHLPKSVCFLYPVPIPECSDVAVDIVPPSLEAMLKNRTGVLKCKSSAENSGFTKITITANNNDIAETEVKGNERFVELNAPIGYEEWSNGTEFTCTVEHSELAGPKTTTFVRENGMGFSFCKTSCSSCFHKVSWFIPSFITIDVNIEFDKK